VPWHVLKSFWEKTPLFMTYKHIELSLFDLQRHHEIRRSYRPCPRLRVWSGIRQFRIRRVPSTELRRIWRS